MKKIFNNCIAIVAIVAILISCESKELQPLDLNAGNQYFPLEIGRYVTYKVDVIDYSVVRGDLKTSYFLKEIVKDTLLDSYNNLTYKIVRYKSLQLDSSWVIDSVWTARKTSKEIIKVENNIPFVKMVVPMVEMKHWNGNIYNSRGEELYSMEQVDKPFVINNDKFDSTFTQIQKKDSSSISQDYRSEIYAKGIGLIQKKSRVTINLQSNGTLIIPIKIDKGFDYTQTIIKYGKE